MRKTSGNTVSGLAKHIDKIQQQRPLLAFIVAVVRKYSDDEAGLQAALLTYYGFLSLFPLLLVATSLTDLIAQHNMHLRMRLLDDITNYFPVVGEQLRQNIHNGHKVGIAFVSGLIVAIYGTHGVGNAARRVLDIAWGVPVKNRNRFPEGMFKSLGILFGAGFGLLLTTVLASYATAVLGHSLFFRLVPLAIDAVLLYLICMFIFTLGGSRKQSRQNVRLGAITTVMGLFILQTIGGYLIIHQLRRTSSVYGQFSLVLVIMFWLYLLAQVFTYAIEINVVHSHKLWPRSLADEQPTAADRAAAQLRESD